MPPLRAEELVRALHEHYQARDGGSAAALLHPESRLDMPASEERLVGAEPVIAFRRDYPKPWIELRVLRVVTEAGSAVAELEVVADVEVLRCAAFWTIQDDLLLGGVEYWVTVGADKPPADPLPADAAPTSVRQQRLERLLGQHDEPLGGPGQRDVQAA